MLTHARLGTNAIARNLDDNCMHMVLCFLFPFAIETEESWDVRKLLEVMKQACYNIFKDEEASDYQDIVEFVLDDSDVGEEDEVEEDEVEDEEEDEEEDFFP